MVRFKLLSQSFFVLGKNAQNFNDNFLLESTNDISDDLNFQLNILLSNYLWKQLFTFLNLLSKYDYFTNWIKKSPYDC